MRSRTAVVIAAIVALTSGCGDDPSKPSQNELAKVFASNANPFGMPLPPKQAECVADVYTDSGLSASYLKTLRSGHTPENVSGSDQEELASLNHEITEDCLSQ